MPVNGNPPAPLGKYLTDWSTWVAEGQKSDDWWRKTLLKDKTDLLWNDMIRGFHPPKTIFLMHSKLTQV